MSAGVALAGLVLFLAFCLRTPPGHAVTSWIAAAATGGDVRIHGLDGDLPNHLSAARVELRDADGVWLTAEGVTLDWDLLALLANHVDISHVRADRIAVLRWHRSTSAESTSSTAVDVGDLVVGRIELDPAVLGRRAVLTASGAVHYASRHDVSADIVLRRLDVPGHYEVHAAIAHDVARGTVTIAEGGDGLVGGAVGMPDIGAVSLDLGAEAQGSSNTIRLKLAAGLLDVSGGGVLDLAARQADIDVSAVSPEMHPNPQLSWVGLSARGHVSGSFDRPDIAATLKIEGLAAGGGRVGTLQAQIDGHGGVAELQATATEVRLPGADPDLLGASPVRLSARADFLAPSRPVRFALTHPLVKLTGQSATRGDPSGTVSLSLPSLAAVARLVGVSVDGAAALDLKFARKAGRTELAADGRIAARGDSTLARLLGDAKVTAALDFADGQNLALRTSLSGAAASLEIAGRVRNGVREFEGDASLSDLSRAVNTLVGSLHLHGRLAGPADGFNLIVSGAALAATKGMAKQEVAISGQALGLPKLRNARIVLSGRLDGTPLSVDASVSGAPPEAVTLTLDRADWRSAHASGSLVVAGSQPSGSLKLKIARLSDLAPLIGQPLAGDLDASADFQDSVAAVHAAAQNLAAGTARAAGLDISGTVADPFGRPGLALAVDARQFAAGDISGFATANLDGTLDALAVRLSGNLSAGEGQDFSLSAEAVVDTAAKHASVNRFESVWREQKISLANPAALDFSDGLKFAATFEEGKAAQLAVGGFVPLKPGRNMDVRIDGTADLGVLTSGLAATGQNLRGKATLNLAVGGTPAKPQITGTAVLTGGRISDYGHGFSLTDIEAAAEAQGTAMRLTRFTARAGPGTVTGTGSIDLAASGVPVDIAFKSDNARPIVSDLMTATMDTDLKLVGTLREGLRLTGQLRVRKGSINLPDKFPPDVVTLDVRRSRAAPAPPAPPPVRIGLDLAVVSDGRVFVRGRGLEAEFEGDLRIAGTSDAPQVLGALAMRRGTLSLAGVNLTFESGTISFNGTSLRRRLDPTLDFLAQTQQNGITATLKVTGTASQPKIELSSSPPLPQDEILAQLLFQQSTTKLSPFQIAAVAQAAASLGGFGGGGFDPVDIARRSLGLDRLAVGSTQGTGGAQGSTTVEAGKYILRNVYVAARQDLSGGTRVLVQVDLYKHLKAQAAVTTGPRAAASTSTPLQDNGDSIGLSYQFEY